MNTKATPAVTAKAQDAKPGLKTIVLIKEHKDAGVVLPVGTELDLLPAIADWLITVGTAEAK